jgi:hypothetical protein
MSHKFSRLVLPYAVIAAVTSSLFLPGLAGRAALFANLIFFGLVVLDPLLPQASPIGKISAPLRTFIVLMAAAFCAAAILFVPAQTLWKPTEIAAPAADPQAAGTKSNQS